MASPTQDLGHANVAEMIAGLQRSDMLADFDCFRIS
jgi:hypothetical protein